MTVRGVLNKSDHRDALSTDDRGGVLSLDDCEGRSKQK